MKGYLVAEARARLGNLLDEAEAGKTVVIERKGVRFVLQAERRARARHRAAPSFEYVDPDVLSGNWTWSWNRGDLRFKARKSR